MKCDFCTLLAASRGSAEFYDYHLYAFNLLQWTYFICTSYASSGGIDI